MKQTEVEYILSCMELLFYAPEGTEIVEDDGNTLKFYGDLDLRKKDIKSLPENLIISGDLDLTLSSIDSLPDNLTVTGTLDIVNTPISHLSENLNVGEDLWVYYTDIKIIDNTNVTVGGLIHIDNMED